MQKVTKHSQTWTKEDIDPFWYLVDLPSESGKTRPSKDVKRSGGKPTVCLVLPLGNRRKCKKQTHSSPTAATTMRYTTKTYLPKRDRSEPATRNRPCTDPRIDVMLLSYAEAAWIECATIDARDVLSCRSPVSHHATTQPPGWHLRVIEESLLLAPGRLMAHTGPRCAVANKHPSHVGATRRDGGTMSAKWPSWLQVHRQFRSWHSEWLNERAPVLHLLRVPFVEGCSRTKFGGQNVGGPEGSLLGRLSFFSV
ncbi:hypothetical protein EV127DRAFT_406844 [Xylaria flabelliformis]|nr:hypothetical protein EV127DRAFT_406844 [Xylaria flabelliformis]